MSLLFLTGSRQFACLDSDSPAVLHPAVSAGAWGAQCQQQLFWKKLTWASWEWSLTYLSWLIFCKTNHSEALLCPWHLLLLCLPFLTLWLLVSSVKNILWPWTVTDIMFEPHWISISSPQRRRTHMRMLTWSGGVWVGRLVFWKEIDLGPPWTGSWTLHLR